MPKIIFKCHYLQQGRNAHSENLIHYIAKREGVQKIDDTWKLQPATKEQIKLIKDILKDYPETKDSFEYDDYISRPTKGSASEFIKHAVDENTDLIGKRENYVGYIAKRPRAERHGAHGLFTYDNIPINLSAVAKEVAQHNGNVWTNVLSLRREDAVRLGYDNAFAWRNLVRSQAETIAQNMKIPLTDLRWYAAYHDESYHPHIHMVVYSSGKEPYLSKQGIDNIRSAFARQIFKQDLLQVYVEQTHQRNALTQKSRDILSDIIDRVNSGSYDNPVVTDLLLKLSKIMKNHKGKNVYGYLTQAGRNIVNAIVDELAKEKNISDLYSLWYEQRDHVTGTYSDTPEKRVPLSQNKEFKAIKNAIIQESLNILYERLSFEEPLNETEDITSDTPEPSPIITEKNKWNDPGSMYFRYIRAKEYLNPDNELFNPAEGIRLLELSAAQGFEYAQYRLGKMYLNGDLVAQDFIRAEMMFEKACAQGNSFAEYSLAKMHLSGTAEVSDESKALRLLRQSSDSGNQWSQYLLGKFCFRGEHMVKDIENAKELLTASADQQNSQAQYLLAKLYLSGDGIPIDALQAINYLSKSAEQNNQYAQYQLGKMLLYGKECERNEEEGIRLLTAAAEQGNIYAVRVLQTYHTGSNRKPSIGLASIRLLAQLSRMFQDRLRRDENGHRMAVDKKLRQQIEEKKQAQGQKMGL